MHACHGLFALFLIGKDSFLFMSTSLRRSVVIVAGLPTLDIGAEKQLLFSRMGSRRKVIFV